MPLSDIPKHVQDAFIATEDIRFYKHPDLILNDSLHPCGRISKQGHMSKGRHYNPAGSRNAFLSQKSYEQKNTGNLFAYQLEKSILRNRFLKLISI